VRGGGGRVTESRWEGFPFFFGHSKANVYRGKNLQRALMRRVGGMRLVTWVLRKKKGNKTTDKTGIAWSSCLEGFAPRCASYLGERLIIIEKAKGGGR